MGVTDDEETLEALFSLYENATISAVPDYVGNDDGFEFNTAEDIREFVEFDDVVITQQHLDTYYDVAWNDGMNNILTMDLTLSFGIIIMFIAAFSDDIDEDVANATFSTMVMASVVTCPETQDGFGLSLIHI